MGIHLITIACLFFFLGTSLNAGAHTLRVGYYDNPPKIFRDSLGQPSGIFADILNAIADREDWTIQYIYGSWNEHLRDLYAGEIDLLPDVARTPERESLYKFHQVPALGSWSQIYTKEPQEISHFGDLREKCVALLRGSTQSQILPALLNGMGIKVRFMELPSYAEVFAMVKNGKCDALAANHYVGEYYAARYSLITTPLVFHPVSLHYAAAQNIPDEIIGVLDRYLNQWQQDPGSPYYRALKQWTTYHPPIALPSHLLWGVAIGALSLLGATMILWMLLRRAEKRYRTRIQILDIFPDAIAYTSSAGIVEYSNSAFRSLFPASLTTKDLSILNILGLRDLEPPVYPIQHICRDLSGKEFTAEIRAIKTFAGHFLWIIRDITDIRQNEARLLHAQKMDVVGKLAGNIAHDFNNNLGIILGYAELAHKKALAEQSNLEELRHIFRAVQSAKEISMHLLTFSRRQPISPKPLNINALIDQELPALRRLCGENITWLWKPASHLWNTFLDQEQMRQILILLCLNARDSITGAGQITLRTANIPAGTEFDQDFIALSVADTGSGMDPSVLPHIFEPFFSTKPNNTGLGLSAVYGMVKQNGGHIRVDSTPGQGSEFRLYFPRISMSEPQASQTGPEATNTLDHHQSLILIVEDDPFLLQLLERLLIERGYPVLATGDPATAIRLADLHGHSIRVLLTDVIMPHMTGKELADLITRKFPHIRCLFMSGYAEEALQGNDDSLNPAHFLQKPFSSLELYSRIAALLNQFP